MEEKSTKLKYKRRQRGSSKTVDSLTEAQKIAFAPFTFQVVAAMLEFGVFSSLNESPKTKKQIIDACNISEYTFDALFEAAICIGLVSEDENNIFYNTKLAEAFLFDEMTKMNFNFMRDICYLGASELIESFKESRPVGLQKYFFETPTIYHILTKLNPVMQKSWYEFDHHYSDDCFGEVLKIIFENNPKYICDIGGNTGKFERACLEYDKNCNLIMVDLPENIEKIKNLFADSRCSFLACDVLSSANLDFENVPDVFFMSQFLDCFSKEQIKFILKKVAKASSNKTKIYILEPFIDNQEYSGAAYSLTHISLYFTCMANGCSKMYKETDMKELVKDSGLKVQKTYYNIGKYDYTLLECVKDEMVSA